MFEYRTQIRMRNTDATGYLFFSEQFNLALEAFEDFLAFINVDMDELLKQVQIPIVHAGADYKRPLKLKDRLKIQLGIKSLGTTSFSVFYLLFDLKTHQEVGRVTIIHVCTDLIAKKSIALPSVLRDRLELHLWEKSVLDSALKEE